MYIHFVFFEHKKQDKTEIKPEESTKIFGVSIADHLARENREYPIPSFFILMLAYFLTKEDVMKRENIFGKFSNVKDFAMLLLQLDDGEFISYDEIGPYTTAGVLVHILR